MGIYAVSNINIKGWCYVGVELDVSCWINAEISKTPKLSTKEAKSSISYVDGTGTHRCHPPLCRACLSQLNIRRGLGERGRWPLGEYCIHKDKLSSHLSLCECRGREGGVRGPFLNPREGGCKEILYKVPWYPNCPLYTTF